MNREIEEEKHLQLIIKELENKNIYGARFVKQDNKVLLLFDKNCLSHTNKVILNSLNYGYPNIIVSINDLENPFDYKELYSKDSNKANEKHEPVDLYKATQKKKMIIDDFKYTGIELDKTKILKKDEQFGYFLEFIKAFQIQELSESKIKQNEKYLKNESSDKNYIQLRVFYNYELINDDFNNNKLSEDPYLCKLNVTEINKNDSTPNIISVELSKKRVKNNFRKYRQKVIDRMTINRMVKLHSSTEEVR